MLHAEEGQMQMLDTAESLPLVNMADRQKCTVCTPWWSIVEKMQHHRKADTICQAIVIIAKVATNLSQGDTMCTKRSDSVR